MRAKQGLRGRQLWTDFGRRQCRTSPVIGEGGDGEGVGRGYPILGGLGTRYEPSRARNSALLRLSIDTCARDPVALGNCAHGEPVGAFRPNTAAHMGS